MPKALLNGITLAESDTVEEVEGNLYFPSDAIVREHVEPSDTHTTCPWKGEASYLTVSAGDERVPDAAWFYPDPKPAAEEIRDHVAFGAPVVVER